MKDFYIQKVAKSALKHLVQDPQETFKRLSHLVKSEEDLIQIFESILEEPIPQKTKTFLSQKINYLKNKKLNKISSLVSKLTKTLHFYYPSQFPPPPSNNFKSVDEAVSFLKNFLNYKRRKP